VTTPASSIDSPALEVHVLGGGTGESIILKLPDDRWGVVDCYSESLSDPDANPTIRFLREKGVTQLFFVCLTHPHDDHYLGMNKLIEEFKPQEFWRFGCLSHEHVRKLLRYHELKAKKSGDEDLSRSARELVDIFEKAYQGAVSRTMRVCRANSQTNPYPKRSDPPASYKIECLSPTGRQVERYEGAVWNCIGPDGKISKDLTKSEHNDISLVLKITYGDTSVVLGGDLEKKGWEDVVEEAGGPNLAASAVKVSHHGSKNGYCDRLWEHFSREGKPIAVVAPRWRYSLPKPDALTHISQHAREIYSTSQPRIQWTPSLPPASPGGPPIESRIKVREAFSAIPAAGRAECGRCSLVFDDKGKVEVEVKPPGRSLVGQFSLKHS
jgi:beta-lactamase superfamily II metal-dependent hydrolase